MYDFRVFTPVGPGGEADVTSSAATVTLRTGSRTNSPDGVRLCNHGSVKCRVLFNVPGATQAAVTNTTGIVLMPGVIEVFRLDGSVSFSVKTESGTTDLNYCVGGGA